ncbi:hypothetical protein B23_0741 [Geobacillus thermoleovorans B23]|nr:hypothetical protein B23_0741 [Geobacillus thermoleovorans B23]
MGLSHRGKMSDEAPVVWKHQEGKPSNRQLKA